MTEADFDKLFRNYWEREYPLTRVVAKNDLHAADDIIQDTHEMVQVKMSLLKYAQQVQGCGCSRTKKNKAMRLFELLGVDPLSIEFGSKSSFAF